MAANTTDKFQTLQLVRPLDPHAEGSVDMDVRNLSLDRLLDLLDTELDLLTTLVTSKEYKNYAYRNSLETRCQNLTLLSHTLRNLDAVEGGKLEQLKADLRWYADNLEALGH